MNLIDIIGFSWMCVIWGWCPIDFDRSACRIERTDNIVYINCYIGKAEEPPLFPEEESEKPKPRRARRPLRGERP